MTELSFTPEAFVAAWSSHDWARVASFFHEDGVYEDTCMGQRHQGHAGIVSWISATETNFSSDVRLELVKAAASETDFYIELRFVGTHDGDGGVTSHLPATGKPFNFPYVAVGTLEGGRIRELHEYWNMADFLGQVGLMDSNFRTN